MKTLVRASAGALALSTIASAEAAAATMPARTLTRPPTPGRKKSYAEARSVFSLAVGPLPVLWYAALASGRWTQMEIEARRFMELAVHVKLASEAVLEAARNVAKLGPGAPDTDRDAWRRAMDELIAMNIELSFMERILRQSTMRGAVAVARRERGTVS
jgi:hypothetical protein